MHHKEYHTCTIDGCARQVRFSGLCNAHFLRKKRHGSPTGGGPSKGRAYQGVLCAVDGCGRTAASLGYCGAHYSRLRANGTVQPGSPLRQFSGRVRTKQGYILVKAPDDYKAMAKSDGYVAEHRLVMAQHLGRCLLPDENVHHRNGQRDDNGLHNLELWSSSQPPGQRVEDKLRWAHWFIERYPGTMPVMQQQEARGRCSPQMS